MPSHSATVCDVLGKIYNLIHEYITITYLKSHGGDLFWFTEIPKGTSNA
jgi:hypothetical protein